MKTRLLISDISIEVQRKNIKNVNLTVLPPDGRVRITAPINVGDETIRHFAISKIDWIRKHINKVKKQQKYTELKYVSGERHYLWGKSYVLEVSQGHRNQVELLGDKLVLTVGDNSTSQQREKLLLEWYRKQLRERLPELFGKWEKVIGVQAETVRIKNMRTRWGSCNIRDKRVWINLQLAKKPLECLEYVIVHELVHLLERSHNSVFKGYMDRFFPNWPTVKKLLNQ